MANRPSDRYASRRRDLASARLGRVTGWVTFGAVGLAGAFSAVVALQLPGHAKGATVTTPASPSTTAPSPTTTTPGSGSSSVQPPAQAPVQTAPPATSAPVTSGGS